MITIRGIEYTLTPGCRIGYKNGEPDYVEYPANFDALCDEFVREQAVKGLAPWEI